jgi:HEAT repeat protein
MKAPALALFALAASLTATLIAAACRSEAVGSIETAGPFEDSGSVSGRGALATAPEGSATGLGSLAHEQAVMKSSFCASCHPDIYAEHTQNTHGRAFTDEEVRLATGRFSQGDCIICHTPRPVFETGIGQNPMRRHHDLEEGNTCMTCHWAEGVDYSRFAGGADCKTAFDDRVGTVEACASCHRNHGTPYQWETAPKGKAAGNDCIDCHMKTVVRPIAVGGEVREVRSHVFPGSRDEAHLRKAYEYDAAIQGNEVVVTIRNAGAGHNFPTELKQRSVESLIVVRDASGAEVARSRMTFRDPYKRPYGLSLPVNTQIPSGQSREHRVPLGVAGGTVECELHFKLYYPIEDHHPEISRRLESRRLAFSGVTPSDKPVESEPTVQVVTPEGIAPETAGPANLVDFAHPPIGAVDVEIPAGSSAQDVERLIELFQFPVPQANGEARKRLIAIGAPAVPGLVRAMGSWDNKTWNQAMVVLEAIGAPAESAVIEAIDAEELYVRLHAIELCGRMKLDGGGEVAKRLQRSLERKTALDRSHAATVLGSLKVTDAAPALRRLVREDRDPDVVRAASLALAALGVEDAVPDLALALERFEWAETRRDVAQALALLGDPSGIPVLLAGLDHPDDLVRESCFEAFFDVTGRHACFVPLAPRDKRLEAISTLQRWWAKDGGAAQLRKPRHVAYKVRSEVRKITEQIGGSDGTVPPGDDVKLRARLVEIGPEAVLDLTRLGLKYPPGFSDKRALICGVLGEIGDPDAVPALVATLDDPVIAVAAWACDSLARIGDDSALPALQRYHQRLLSLAAWRRIPEHAGSPDSLISQAASTCYRFGDTELEPDLEGFLLSDDATARRVSFDALREAYGPDLQYDPDASADDRRAMVEHWRASRP